MEKSCDHGDVQERRRCKSREPQADLLSSTTLQTLLHDAMQMAKRRVDRQKDIPNNGPPYDVQTQKSRVSGIDMWVEAMDFKKAFDFIQHESIRNSIRKHSICEQYICFLKNFSRISVPPYWLMRKVTNSASLVGQASPRTCSCWRAPWNSSKKCSNISKTYGSTWSWNPPKQDQNPHNPDSKRTERNRNWRDAGWDRWWHSWTNSAFTKHWQELTPVHQFDVTPTIRSSTQRRMLRLIVRTKKDLYKQERNWRKRHSRRRNQWWDCRRNQHKCWIRPGQKHFIRRR